MLTNSLTIKSCMIIIFQEDYMSTEQFSKARHHLYSLLDIIRYIYSPQ